MSEKPPAIFESVEDSIERPNIILNFEGAVDVVVEIEKQIASEISPRDREIIKMQMSEALASLLERKESVSIEDLDKFEKRSIQDFKV